MTTKKITAVYMENGLKRNWTVEDFCQDLGIEEKEFKRILKKHFSQKVERYYLSRLATNQKLYKKTSKHNSTNQVGSEDSTPIEQNVPSRESEEQIEEGIDTLESWKRKEERLKQLIYDFEIEIKDLRVDRKNQKVKLEKIYKCVQSLIEKLEAEYKNLDEVNNVLNRIDSRIDEICSEKSLLKKELIQVQETIKELELITIFFTATGEVKAIGFDREMPELEIDSTLQQMMEIDLLEDLTLKELRAMAKIIATAVYVENTTGREVKFDFEEKDSNISVAIELLKLQEQEMTNC